MCLCVCLCVSVCVCVCLCVSVLVCVCIFLKEVEPVRFVVTFHMIFMIVFHSIVINSFSRKRPRRVLSKKALSLNIVIKHCLESSAEVMAVLKDCHQRLPKVLLK